MRSPLCLKAHTRRELSRILQNGRNRERAGIACTFKELISGRERLVLKLTTQYANLCSTQVYTMLGEPKADASVTVLGI